VLKKSSCSHPERSEGSAFSEKSKKRRFPRCLLIGTTRRGVFQHPIRYSRCQIKQALCYPSASKPLARHLQLYLDKYGTCMVTYPLIVSRQANRSALHSRLSTSSQVTKSPVVHPLSIHQVTKCFSRNSFVLKPIHFDGGCGVYPYSLSLSRPRSLRRYVPSPIRFLFTFLHTLLRFFALTKNSTLLFSSDSALFAQNTRGLGVHFVD